MEEGAECGKSLIKKLASCEKSIRDRSLRAVLERWLPNQTQVSDEDMKKLWQGLFYCVWHADKVVYQSDLINRLSAAVISLPLPLSFHYSSAFLFTMRREWSRIDRLRLDKFYLLIRRFLNGFFLLLKNNSWDLDFTRRLMSVLLDGTFLADDKFQGNGVNYHIASVFVEELRHFLPLRKEVVELLFGPLVTVLGIVNDKILVGKIKSNVFDELLKMGRKLLEIRKSAIDADSNDDAVVLGPIALAMEFSRKFYELGSSQDCYQGNRKPIFALHKEFLKLEKDMSSCGVEVLILDPRTCGPYDEVPDLVPMASEVENDCSNAVSESTKVATNGSSKNKGLKKCTKAKKASGGSDKKGGKKSKKETTVDIPKIASSNGDEETFSDSLISNLQLQFEKVASELGSKNEVTSACEQADPMMKSAKVSKKRKRGNPKAESANGPEEAIMNGDAETSETAKTSEKSTKRVRFSMKNNLVWKPHSPLPPQSLRLPPSTTPRGSALKKGIPPGPIREMPSPSRKGKQKTKALKKPRKGVKTLKRLKKKKSP